MNPILLRRWLSVWLFGSLLLGRSWADPVPQTLEWISPPPGTLLRLGQNYPLGATASSGLPVTFRVAAGPASITDGQVTVTNSGRVTLVAEQAGSAHAAPATAFTTFNRGKLLFETVGGLSLGADWTSDSFSLVVSKGVAYAGSFSGLRTVDVRDPANPKLLDFIATSGTVFDLQILSAYAFLATSAGMEVIDISNPAELSRTAQLPIGGGPYSLRLAGNLAYVAAGTVWIVDISQPNQPRKVGEIAEPFPSARDVAVVGDVLFVGGNGGVRTYDVSEAATPALLATFGNPTSAEIEVVDGNLWVADNWGNFQVWDVGNPRTPVMMGSSQFPFGTIPIGFGMRLFAFDGLAFITQQQSGLLLMDAANAANPIDLGTVTGPYPNAMQVAEGLHFEVGYGGSFRVFRRREPLTQELQFAPPSLANFGSPIRLTAAASSGLPVAFRLLSGPAELEGDQLVATGPGIVTVRAEQSGNEQFSPVSSTRSVSFVPAGAPLGWAVDPSLQLDPTVWGQISSLVSMPDGSIVAAGPALATAEYVDEFGGQIVRLSPDGALLPSLASWAGVARELAIGANMAQVTRTPRGDLLALTHTRTGGVIGGFRYVSMLFRLSDGDSEWRYENGFDKAVAVFPDLVGGAFVGGGNNEFIPGTAGDAWFLAFGRLNADFQPDPRFALPPEYGATGGGPSSINYIRPLPDGGALVAGAIMFPFNRGWEYWPNTAVFRLGPDGKLVWRHTLDSPHWLTPANFVAELPGNRLVLFPSREVLDLNTGVRLGTFPIPAEVTARTTTYFQEPDGRLILSGTFTNFAGITRRGLAAVWPDGALDLSFDPGQGTTNAFAAIAREADGSLLLGGAPGTFDGFAHRGLIRLVKRNPNFTPPTAPVFHVQATPAIAECAYPGEVHVVRTGLTSQTNRVRVQTLAETATAGADFVAVDTELVFRPGEGAKTVPLTVLGDQLPEGTESFRVLVNFEPGTSVLGATNLQVLIGDVDCGVRFFTNAMTLPESAGDSWQIAVSAENPPPGFTTRLRTRAITAEPGRDFLPWDGSPVVQRAVLLRPRDNAIANGPRQFVLEAYDATTGESLPGPPALTVTLTDDDTLAGPYRRIAGSLGGITPLRDGWLVFGDFPTADGHQRPGLARFTFSGSFDDLFNPPGDLAGWGPAVAGTPDGGLLAGGRFDVVDGIPTAGVLRLDVRGRPVSGFQFRAPANGTNCLAQNEAKAILVEPDGSSFIAGSFPAFFGCDAAPRVLRVTTDGEVIASWPIPGHQANSGFTLAGNGRGKRILQGNAGVFAVEEGGLTRLTEVDLGYGAPLAVLPDGGLVGIAGTTLVHHAPDGTLVAEVKQFRADGIVWDATWLHTVVVRSDGRILVSGVFQPANSLPGGPRVFTLAVEPSTLASDQPAAGDIANGLRLTGAVAHPSGALAALNVFDFNRPESQWWRLDELGQPIADLEFQNVVADDVGRLHLALRGQAPGGYAVEVSEDLVNWMEWFRSPEINWGQSFVTPELPADLAGRYFRLRF